jgi:hypothetical protein
MSNVARWPRHSLGLSADCFVHERIVIVSVTPGAIEEAKVSSHCIAVPTSGRSLLVQVVEYRRIPSLRKSAVLNASDIQLNPAEDHCS